MKERKPTVPLTKLLFHLVTAPRSFETPNNGIRLSTLGKGLMVTCGTKYSCRYGLWSQVIAWLSLSVHQVILDDVRVTELLWVLFYYSRRQGLTAIRLALLSLQRQGWSGDWDHPLSEHWHLPSCLVNKVVNITPRASCT